MLPSVLITKVKHARAIKVLKLARKEKEKILYIILVEDGEIVRGCGTMSQHRIWQHGLQQGQEVG